MSAPDLLLSAWRICISDQSASTEEENLFWRTQDWAGHRTQAAAHMQKHDSRTLGKLHGLTGQFFRLQCKAYMSIPFLNLALTGKIFYWCLKNKKLKNR